MRKRKQFSEKKKFKLKRRCWMGEIISENSCKHNRNAKEKKTKKQEIEFTATL